MSEVYPLCARAIVDEIDERFRSDIDDQEVLDDLRRATIRAIISRTPTNIKSGQIHCQVDGCSAVCTLFEFSDGLFKTLPLIGEDEPIVEEQCAKLSSDR